MQLPCNSVLCMLQIEEYIWLLFLILNNSHCILLGKSFVKLDVFRVCSLEGAQIKVLLEDDVTPLCCQLCEFFLCCDSHPWLVRSVSAWKPSEQFRVRDCGTVNSAEKDSRALLNAVVGESWVRPQQPSLQNAKWHLLQCFPSLGEIKTEQGNV